MARRKKGDAVSGWVCLDKPYDFGSTQAVGRVRWLFNAQKAGHAGTLDPLATGVLPIALGEAAAPLGLAPAEVAQLYLQGFAANLCLIATRHIPLGQTEGQAVLAQLLPDIVALGESAALADTADLGSATLAADLAAMQHETMDVRIFRT